jgi:hypothetical protein
MSHGTNHRHEASSSHSQLVFRRHPETRQPIEGYLRWGFSPHDAGARPLVKK